MIKISLIFPMLILSEAVLACSCDMDFAFGTIQQKFDDHEVVIVATVESKQIINGFSVNYTLRVDRSFKGASNGLVLLKDQGCPHANYEVGESHLIYTTKNSDGSISPPAICMLSKTSEPSVQEEIRKIESMNHPHN